jgi:diguanylate cyclase
LKTWVQKLIEQFDMDFNRSPKGNSQPPAYDLTEDRATLLYIVDSYSKHLIDTDAHPARKVREILDEFSKSLLLPENQNNEKLLFRLRQFFSSYRIEEYSYIEKTFEDFKNIIWDFADQLSEEVQFDKKREGEIKVSLDHLREAVESNSIQDLRSKSREFIDFYIEHQTEKDARRSQRMNSIKKNLDQVKKKLTEANMSMRRDHLTGAYNRRSYDEQMKRYHQLNLVSKTPSTLIALDIDFFKKVNDTYGHHVGDCVLKECVKYLNESFTRDEDFVARVGGEEFAVILPECGLNEAVRMAEAALEKVRSSVYRHNSLEIRFTISMGVAELLDGESDEAWQKRADEALYKSKHSGRNRITVAPHPGKVGIVA